MKKESASPKLTVNEIMHKCRYLLDSYRSEFSPDEYIEVHIDAMTEGNDVQKMFLLQTFNGIFQYSELLTCVTDAIYAQYNILNTDKSTVLVIVYFLVIDFDVLHEKDQLAKLLYSAGSRLSKQILSFLSTEENIQYIVDQWHHIYEIDFVTDQFEKPLRSHGEEMKMLTNLMDELDAHVGEFSTIPPTKTKEFVFNETRMREINTDYYIPQPRSFVHSVPRSTYIAPKNLAIEHKMHREHDTQARGAKLLQESDRKSFKCAKTEKSLKTVLRMEQVKLEDSRKNSKQKPKARPAPKFNSRPAIKQTAAGILREEKLYAKREEESFRSLERLLQGARDMTEYNEWQKNVAAEKKAEAETKKVENIIRSKITREEAILSKQREIDQKKSETDELKAEKTLLLRRKEKADAKELVFIKIRIAEIAEADRNCNAAREALQEEKSKLVKVQQKERDAAMKDKMKKEETEMAKKKLMIKEIRMLEAEIIEDRNNNKVPMDLTETAGHSLLGEMSLLELRERLALANEKHKLDEEEKRGEILENKKKFEMRLLLAQEKVNAHRSLQIKEQAALKSNIPLVKSSAIKNGEDKLAVMKRLLEEKQKERMKIQTNSINSRRSTPIQ